MADDNCPTCGKPVSPGDWPWCPHGRDYRYSCIPDDYGRDIVCETMAHEPVTYRTRSERRRLMREHGVIETVRHVGQQGSDKSPHTTRWI